MNEEGDWREVGGVVGSMIPVAESSVALTHDSIAMPPADSRPQ